MQVVPRRVLVVDDDDLFRGLLSDALRRRGYRVASCEGGQAALRIANAEGFDVVCLDVDLGTPENGFDVAEQIVQIRPDAPIIFLTAIADPDYLRPATLARLRGASYLLKSNVRNIDQLVQAIEMAAAGRFFVDKEVLGIATSNPRGLTDRQLEVLRLAARGLTNTAIGDELGITPGAVERIFSRTAKTLGVEASKQTNSRAACIATYLHLALRG